MVKKSSGSPAKQEPDTSTRTRKLHFVGEDVDNTETIEESRQQPVWHVVILTILSCTAYIFYWFYKTWRDLEAEAQLRGDTNPRLKPFSDISPLLRTTGIVVPMFSIYLGFPILVYAGIALILYLGLTLFDNVAKLNPHPESFPRRHPLVSALLVMLSMSATVTMARVLPMALSEGWYLVSFLVGVPLAIVQHWLNQYYASLEKPGLLVRQAFSVKELVVIIVGGMLLGLNVTGLMLHP